MPLTLITYQPQREYALALRLMFVPACPVQIMPPNQQLCVSDMHFMLYYLQSTKHI